MSDRWAHHGRQQPKPAAVHIIVHKKSSYYTGEFIDDPRIEMLYAKATTLGGGGTLNTNGTSPSGLPSPTNTNSTPATPPDSGNNQ